MKLQKIPKALKLSERLMFPEVYGMPKSQKFFPLSLTPNGLPRTCWDANCIFTPMSRKKAFGFFLILLKTAHLDFFPLPVSSGLD